MEYSERRRYVKIWTSNAELAVDNNYCTLAASNIFASFATIK